MSTTRLVDLSCGDMIIIAATHVQDNNRYYCPRHRESYIGTTVTEYTVKCEDCRYSRSYGAAKLTAERAGSRHAGRMPGHYVNVRLGKRHVASFAKPAELPFPTDEPPY